MATLKIERRLALPTTIEASTFYIIKSEEPDLVDIYFTDENNTELRHVITKAEIADLIANNEHMHTSEDINDLTNVIDARTNKVIRAKSYFMSFK